MKKKLGKLLFMPILVILTFAISCTKTADPNAPVSVYGCMDPQSINYNPNATIDDKSCVYAKTDQQASNAVIELYLGVRTQHGPEAQILAQNIKTAYPDVIIMNIHTGPDAIAKMDWPDYTTGFGKAIADSAGMNQSQISWGGGSVNRYHFTDVPLVSVKKMMAGDQFTVLYKDGFLPAVNYWLVKPSPVNIGLATYWTETGRKLKILVELYYKTAETLPNYLNVALLENGLIGKQLYPTDTIKYDYVHNHVLRDLITPTPQWGELLSGTTVGARIRKTYVYNVPDKYNIDNCDIAVFISREINGKKVYILTGKQKKAK